MKKSKKIVCATLSGAILLGVFSPVSQVFAATSMNDSLYEHLIIDNSRMEHGSIDFELLEQAFTNEFKDQNSVFSVQERGIASTAVKTAVKWIKSNAKKIANVLAKYVGFKGGVDFIIDICDAVAGASATVDELVYNLVDAMFPSWSDNTVARVTDIIRAIMPF